MNKQELIERMAGKTGLSKKDCGTALTGFGCFAVKHRAAGTRLKDSAAG